MQYGEQRDLFCNAAAGLQDMFKPPSPSNENFATDDSQQHESTMASSPPQYPQRVISADLYDLEPLPEIEEFDDEDDQFYPNDLTPSPSPRRAQREIKYKLNVDDSLGPSEPSHLQSRDTGTPVHQEDESFPDESHLEPPSDASGSIRKVSGQSVIRNEDFSPIMIGKQSTGDGKVDFAPIEVPVDQLKQKLEALRINQMLLDPKTNIEAGFDANEPERSASVENTEDYARQGGFLNMQRGGRSKDGSFRYRALSPGLGDDSSSMLPEESLQASTPKQFPSVRTDATNPYQGDYFSRSPAMPRAPFPSPEKKRLPTAGSIPSAGSPLKLFGPYDTFTNQTLLRRISQFEDGISGATSRQSPAPDDEHDLSATHEDEESNPYEASRVQQRPPLTRATSISQFGGGDLEGYEFSEDVSFASHEQSALDEEDLASPQSLPSHHVEPIFQIPSRPSSPDEESELVVRRKRNKSVTSSSSKHSRTLSASSVVIKAINPALGAPEISATPKRDSGSEGKRRRTSPSKDPTPKRRRTLHKTDIAFGREEHFAAVDTAHRQMQSAMGKKRKDARPGDFELANPNVLAMRSFLRPRTPTPSQRSSQQRENHPFAEDDVEGQPEKSPLRALQNENLPLSSNPNTPGEVERKPSIRTQDFVDQAALIMAMIRNQVRPPGLSSVEESEAENGTPKLEDSDDSYQESTKEPFSRPPSREGRPLPRPPMHQEDPELLKRLKKYQELSDMGDLISSSMRSMNLVKDALREAQELERQIEVNSRTRSDAYATDDEVISDPPNMRISTNPFQKDSPGSPNRDFPSHSSGFSTNHSFPTGSSRGSESRKTIMPESISHLIPDRVGSMFLDKQNNIWIKKKGQFRPRRSSNILPSEDSEDDPFASIPDLSVDMTREMQNLLLTTAQKDFAAVNPEHVESPVSPSKSPSGRPNKGVVTVSPSSPLSPDVPTLVREGIRELDARVSEALNEDEDEDLERDFSFADDSVSNPTSTTRRRNLTITFSSPIASIIHDVVAEDLDCLDDDVQAIPTPKKSPGYGSVGKSALKHAGQGSVRSNRTPSRNFTSTGPAFIPRPVSRIDEQDEESTIEIPMEDQRQISILGETSIIHHKSPDGRRTSLSFIVNRTPASNMVALQSADESALIGQNVGKLSLSPLSEFTLNNSDQSFGFEVSYVMGRRHLSTGDGCKKVMSMTIRELVDKLSEVEPFEPYWEDMTELDLCDKRLGSLHMLDEFCGKLVTLDASKNALGHLDGVPSTVRQLKVSFNMLTELTSWDHLMNLQYVDVSGNELKSLSALKNLVHLRSIRADNNQLTSLDGLELHDGLLSLRARNNLIEEVDCSRIEMARLTDLDLEGNQITAVQYLEMLPSLNSLKLGNNKLQTFSIQKSVKSLRQLDLSDNELTTLNIGNLPSLHSLHADRNRITGITGFGRARRLDSLSLREQRGEGLDLEFLSEACEVRKLFLSGNYLGAFEPTVDFLNLQLLEVANCGLQALPENLGQLMPNLRSLNLSFNAIGDLAPLRFIPRLKKLQVAGNRLADSTAVTELLTDFPHLTQLDLRDNPVTIGFYPPVQVVVSSGEKSTYDPFTLPKADIERDDLFASRLDEATKLRRRLHHIVFVASCKRLRTLDGLPISRSGVLNKDEVYQMLVAEGLLPDETLVESVSEKNDSCHKMANETEVIHKTDTLRSSRWNAEDSFA